MEKRLPGVFLKENVEDDYEEFASAIAQIKKLPKA